MTKIELNNSIIIHADNDYRQACRTAFQFLRIPEHAKGKDKIVIKPNLVCCRPYEEGSVTDPLVLDTLLGQIRETFDGDILIAEAEAIFKSRSYFENRVLAKTTRECQEGFQISLENAGVLSVLEKRNDPKIRVFDVSDTEYEDPEIIRERVLERYGDYADKISVEYLSMVPKCFLQGNILGINLAKFKSHDFRPTMVTLAVKNFFGFSPDTNREHLHGAWHNPWRLAESVVSMLAIYTSIFSSWLHVVEGLRYCMEGDGPVFGTTVRNWGKIAAGANPIELDAICARMMGQNPHELPYLVKASQCLGGFDKQVITRIPDDFIRTFTLHRHVSSWLEAECSHNPYISYLKLVGYVWNRTPRLAYILSYLSRGARRLIGIFRR